MNNLSKKTQNYIYLAIIAVACIAIIILFAGYHKDKKEKSDEEETATTIAQLRQREDNIVVTVDTEMIEEGLENMGFLVTQEYYYTQVERYTKEKKIFNVLPSSSEFMYSYDGKVLAGIDFEKIKVTKDDTSKTINVEIPKSRIYTVTIDEDTFKIYSEKDSLWNPLNLEDYNISLAEFEDSARKKAKDSGILDRSDEQAKSLVENFIANFPLASEYEIEFDWRDDNES